MEIKTLKDLEKAIKLCRKLGVDTIEIGSVKFQMGAIPILEVQNRRLEQTTINSIVPGGITEEITIPTTPGENFASLTEEQQMFYSAGIEQ